MRVRIRKGSHIFAELLKADAGITAYCGGNGRCGKCRVRVTEGRLPETETEKRLLSDQERRSGVRLACCHQSCEEDVVLELWDEAQRFEALGALKETYPVSAKEEGRGIALDIGTTTVVAAELDLSSGRLLKETKVLNTQRRFV